MKTAIESGDAAEVRRLIAEDPARANELVVWGKRGEIGTHPLHYVSDMVFSGTLARESAVAVVDALLSGGADCNYAAPNGETALIGAASLLAEDVGLRLLEAGADPHARGAFRETALHWAAHVGLKRLVAALIARGADVNLRDARYESTPLGWALHGSSGRRREVVALLVEAGAEVTAEMRERMKEAAD